MITLPLSRLELYTQHYAKFIGLGLLILSQSFFMPRGWALLPFTGFALLSLGIYSFALPRWKSDPGLWMLAALLVVLWTPCWMFFEYKHWQSVFAKRAALPQLTWPQIRFLIDAVLGLSAMAESTRLSVTVARENWKVTRPPTSAPSTKTN